MLVCIDVEPGCMLLFVLNCFQADLGISSGFGCVRFAMTAVPLYSQSKQARGYKAFTRQSCPTFPLCASAAGLRCIIHEHSVNLLIQNMSSLFLCLIYCLSFFHSVIPYLCFSLPVFLSPLFLFFCSFPPIGGPDRGTRADTTTD